MRFWGAWVLALRRLVVKSTGTMGTCRRNYTVRANPQKVDGGTRSFTHPRPPPEPIVTSDGFRSSQPRIYGSGHEENHADDGVELKKCQLHPIERLFRNGRMLVNEQATDP